MGRGRPHLAIGTYGEIFTREIVLKGKPGKKPKPCYEARALFRDNDGVSRSVAKRGQTITQAKAELKMALVARQHKVEKSTIDTTTTVTDLAGVWLDLGTASGWATNTVERYSLVVNNQIVTELGNVRVAELRRSNINTALTNIMARHGSGSAKTAKTVLAGMCKLAMSYDALDSNPVRDTISISAPRKDRVRALTVDEVTDLCDRFRSDYRAVQFDLPDLVDFMLGTGARIGEACAARLAVLDREAGTWEINATVVRVKGAGLTIQERPKTAAGWRVLALPPYCVGIISRRSAERRVADELGVLFGSPRAKTYRDPSNTAGDLREVLDRIGCPTCDGRGWHASVKPEGRKAPKSRTVRLEDGTEQDWDEPCTGAPPYAWVHSHIFRKTVATRLDEGGMSPRAVADQLGHAKPSMTQDVYMGRKVVSADAARLLNR